MRLLYTVLLYLATPVVLLRLLWRGLKQREYWHRIGERFGFGPKLPEGVAVWVHAVSVGESLAALPLIRGLLDKHPGSVLVTTTTPTGSERVRAALGDAVHHRYAPYDLPGAVERFLRRTGPRRAIVMETELWPNLFRALAKQRVPIIIANARLSPRSFAGYRRLRGFAKSTLADCKAIAAQSDADAQRFRELGADPEHVQVLGNLKFDLEMPEEMLRVGHALRWRWGEKRPVWIAASTHAGEEEAALRAHRILLKRQPDAVLVLVPRHPQRFDDVAQVIERSGLAFRRRSSIELPAAFAPGAPAPLPPQADLTQLQVLLGDSMGELPMYFAAADIAFVGGSLVDVGGHNVLEPASLGLPVLFGPHMYNFEQARSLLLQSGAARQVDGAMGIEPALAALFQDAAAREAMGR
ncbi:MAG TPA: lipid IV(A) 3-deoxy-D-manno-octulosonic acid transferase, partial [Verrucomicrobiae bacterium]|nr:lipid IV(A) 3-deoxy-D-manno-octulosonic acid transferase [Verrucomicrobiae bacterium]